MQDELLRWRSEFPILEKTVYMVSHSLGAMPRKVYDKLCEFADMWATRGVRAWAEGWWEMPSTVGDRIARIINADPGEVVMHQNVSICESILLSCFDFKGKRRKIVYSELEFPSVMYVYEAHARGGLAEIVTVPSDDGITVPTERMLAAIDEQTLLVPISHVLFKSGYIQDVKAIIERAHAVGAYVILDVYQSAGTVPVDVKLLDVDFVVGGSVKWLCGGPGAGYLYVRKDHRSRLEPKTTGWMAHREPFAFKPGAIDYAENIFRFLHGSPLVPSLYSAQAGYDIINEIGVERIREKSVRQTTLLVEGALERGWRVNSPLKASERGGMVVVDLEHAQAVTKELLQRDILVDYRPGAGIRIAPHFYTKDEEIEEVLRAMDEIIATKAYEKHLGSAAVRI
ncbi:MAG: aminotransferase class V-fold PLP-dependent enzyme [Acidobacteriota bacterium]|nr:aminotransferase class V-fold PLP-dependent enzyme [Blastocatellia bacterium]MDW8413654.1 aminotransferase class V-fold PLP-dependent enzyme [Acidobacteriota bacterium]